MTHIQFELDHLPAITSDAQAGLPLPSLTFNQPISIQGDISTDAILKDIRNHFINNAVAETDDRGHVSEDSSISQDSSIQPCQITIGIDEVGRGPLYGSVVVAGAVLPSKLSAELTAETSDNVLNNTVLSKLTDSKKLTEPKREALFEPIKHHALAYILVDVPSVVIDQINILQATLLGMRLASEQLMIELAKAMNSTETEDSQMLSASPSIQFNLLIDGNKIPDLDIGLLAQHGIGSEKGYPINSEAWIKGDGRHTAIAAASVLAKVTRDRQVVEDANIYPGYGLEGHKGYPTKAHIEAINRLGVLPQHRRSFKPVQVALETSQAKDNPL